MAKRSFTIAFKKEVIEFMLQGKTCCAAKQHFEVKNGEIYDHSMFQQWFRNKDKLANQKPSMKRALGAGKKTSLGTIEQIICDEIIDLRIRKMKVSRKYISDRAVALSKEFNIKLKATGNWITGFMKRNGFTLRRTTNLTTLSDSDIILRAVNYMKYLKNRLPYLNIKKTLMMDETAVFFEDARTNTVDLLGARHVVMKSTGFSSMRVTALISIWADGRKAMPLVIHKGKDGSPICKQNRILHTTQSKSWVNQELIIKWIDHMFPLIDLSNGKCIIWDSCRVHLGLQVKEHCIKRNVEMIVIPGGLTPYLQAGDIGIFRSLKDLIYFRINEWKNSDSVVYTKNGNPKPPSKELVNSWVGESLNELKTETIQNSIISSGFSSNPDDWHIAKHDVYGRKFCEAWAVSNQIEQFPYESISGEDVDDQDVDCLDDNDDVECLDVVNE